MAGGTSIKLEVETDENLGDGGEDDETIDDVRAKKILTHLINSNFSFKNGRIKTC